MIQHIHPTHLDGNCLEILGSENDWLACDKPAILVECNPRVPGRRVVTACYCYEHGGHDRALDEVGRSWSVLAPAEVGDDEAVLTAGTASLDSRHAYLILRSERNHWLAWRGIGGFVEALYPPGVEDRRAAIIAAHLGSRKTAKLKARREAPAWWTTREDALRDATAEWRRKLVEDVAEITRIRGGTLSWGMPIAPRDEPIIILPRELQSAYAALHEQKLTAMLGEPVVGSREQSAMEPIPPHELSADATAGWRPSATARESVLAVIWTHGKRSIILQHDGLVWGRDDSGECNLSTNEDHHLVDWFRGDL